MPGRKYNTNAYRYGLNGQEKDDEINSIEGAYTSAEYWEYDARLGRRWNVDPVFYPSQSTYLCFNDNPIYFVDPSGLEGEGDGTRSRTGEKEKISETRAYARKEVDVPSFNKGDGPIAKHYNIIFRDITTRIGKMPENKKEPQTRSLSVGQAYRTGGQGEGPEYPKAPVAIVPVIGDAKYNTTIVTDLLTRTTESDHTMTALFENDGFLEGLWFIDELGYTEFKQKRDRTTSGLYPEAPTALDVLASKTFGTTDFGGLNVTVKGMFAIGIVVANLKDSNNNNITPNAIAGYSPYGGNVCVLLQATVASVGKLGFFVQARANYLQTRHINFGTSSEPSKAQVSLSLEVGVHGSF